MPSFAHTLLAVWLCLAPAIVCAGHAGATGAASSAHGVERSLTPLDHLPALRGDYFPLRATASGHDYHVYVRLPEGYDDHPERQWPVVYLLDGDSLFPLLATTHLFLHYDERLPDAVIVGIAYGEFDPAVNLRHIDFSAPGTDTPHGEGGAPAFLDFLRGQLLPETERRYRIDPDRRVLVGQSRGGYFVLWSALQAPDLFHGRIASNPVFHRSRQPLFAAPAVAGDGRSRLALVNGTRDDASYMRNGLAWTGFWDARQDRPFTLRHIVLEGGTHAASIGETYRLGMTWLFDEEIAAAHADAHAR